MLNSINKTILYARRNGLRAAFFAARERLEDRKKPYTYVAPLAGELDRQRRTAEEWAARLSMDEAGEPEMPLFSILVPCYHTPEQYFREMIDSVLAQTYPDWELIIADASDNSLVSDTRVMTSEQLIQSTEKSIEPSTSDNTISNLKKILDNEYSNENRIRYIQLTSNKGISANTNEAIKAAKGDYCCLLDHDDVLTPDALFQVAQELRYEMMNTGITEPDRCHLRLIYSDEDKCNSDMTLFYEPNIKPDFNLDYLLSNNYICHFTTIRTDILRKTMFRPEYDGAQDYDVILRVCLTAAFGKDKKAIRHIPRVLYHWRCHGGSTAANPASKRYAYEAGRAAVQDNLQAVGVSVWMTDLPHVGFYRQEYQNGIFKSRKDIGIVGGRLIAGRKGKYSHVRGTIVGGNLKYDGTVLYEGLHKEYSGGFAHMAACQQDAEAVDIRCMRIRKSLRPLFKQITGLDYLTISDLRKAGQSESAKDNLQHINVPDDWSEEKIRSESIRFCKAAAREGYRIFWDPQMERTI